MDKLTDINWLHIGQTDEYAGLKTAVAHVCRDVTNAGSIDEVCLSDILHTLERQGYSVVKAADLSQSEQEARALSRYWHEGCSGTRHDRRYPENRRADRQFS
jgi:hypothetical protein